MIIQTREQLENLLQKWDEICIYGAGTWGRQMVDYLIDTNRIDKVKCMLVTELENNMKYYRNVSILKFDIKTSGQKNILICVKKSLSICEYLEANGLKDYSLIKTNAFLLEPIENKGEAKFTGLDFVSAGFYKCGTTTLHTILKSNENIYLPKQKETYLYFLKEKHNNAREIWEKSFFSEIKNGQLVGSIEPTFYKHAKDLYEDFGKELKVILVLRNPINAFYSIYKMMVRKYGGIEWGTYESGIYSSKGFDVYSDRTLNQECIYLYERWVAEFIDIFGEDNVHIVLFEDMIENPKIIINKIYRFLGVEGEYEFSCLPKENSGDFVMATKEGAELARKKSEYISERNINPNSNILKTEKYAKVCEDYDKAEKIYNPKLEPYQKEKLYKFFYKSVRNLEKIINRDLSEIWF